MGWWEDHSGLDATVAVVTGGAGGLGAAVTFDLVANGVKVAVLDRDPAAGGAVAQSLAATGADLGADVILQVGDVRDRPTLEALFTAADARWGRLDSLVDVVGGTFRAAFEDTNEQGWEALLRTNLLHVFHACSLAIPRIRTLQGRQHRELHHRRGSPGGTQLRFLQCRQRSGGTLRQQTCGGIGARCDTGQQRGPRHRSYTAPGPRQRAEQHAPRSARCEDCPCYGTRRRTIGHIRRCRLRVVRPLPLHHGHHVAPDGGTWAAAGWFNWPGEGYSNGLPVPVLDHFRNEALHGS